MKSSKRALVTGALGLVGSHVCTALLRDGYEVVGVDNLARAVYFGPSSAPAPYKQAPVDVRQFSVSDKQQLFELVRDFSPTVVVHCAAQPSHDFAAREPFVDFDANALGTLTLLEAIRTHAPEAIVVHFSTNKVYGDAPNRLALVELPLRWDYAEIDGVDETLPLDGGIHSLFGVSKVAADLYAQEYGRNFGLKTVILRGGCLTGVGHASCESHGFLSHFVKCAVRSEPYTVFGYAGKQVRDQLDSRDIADLVLKIASSPVERPGEVYNLGGGRANSVSIVELTHIVARATGKRLRWKHSPTPRVGDHVCYVSDCRKLLTAYGWSPKIGLEQIVADVAASFADA